MIIDTNAVLGWIHLKQPHVGEVAAAKTGTSGG